MSERKFLVGLLAVALMLTAGCAVKEKLQSGQKEFIMGRAAKAESIIKPLESKTDDKDYPLVLLSLGSIDMTLGDYRQASMCFQAALANLDIEIGGLGAAGQMLKSESGRLYRGFPHEKVLAHTYLGLAYIQQGRLDEARIEFAKAAEEDKGKDAGQDDDYAPAHYLDGLRALKSGDYEHARVSFRKVLELAPEFAPGWYALARASLLAHDETEAGEAWEKYESLSEPSERLARDGSTPCAIFIIDVGWGPHRDPDVFIGEFAVWKETGYAARTVRLGGVGRKPVSAQEAGDMYYQASTTGGFGEDLKKKVVSAAAKEAVSQLVPFAGLFMKTEADVRAWAIAPGGVHFAVVPVPRDPTTIELTAVDKNGTTIPIDNQVMYYITGRPFEEAQLIYARVLPNADYRW